MFLFRLTTTASNSTDIMRKNRIAITRKLKREEKQLYGYFKQQTNEISYGKTWIWLRKETFIEELNLF